MIPLRLARELTYQLEHAGEHERLAEALAEIPIFHVLFQGEEEAYVLMLWKRLSKVGLEPDRYFRPSLEKALKESPSKILEAIDPLLLFFEIRSTLNFAVELIDRLLPLVQSVEDRRNSMILNRWLGVIHRRQGNYVLAQKHIEEMLQMAELVHDEQMSARALGDYGNVLFFQGYAIAALEYYERQLSLCESLHDMRATSHAIGNIGNVYAYQGEFEKAIQWYRKQFDIAQSLGDKLGMSRALGNIGSAYALSGKLLESLAYFERDLPICEALDNKHGILNTIGNMGNVFALLGRYDDALSSLQRQLQLSKEIRDQRLAASCTGNMGNVYKEQWRFQEALPFFQDSLQQSRAINDLANVTNMLFGIAEAILQTSAAPVSESRATALECLEISTTLGKYDTILSSHLLLARIDAAEGNAALATEKLEAMLAEAIEEEQIADLHYWLWKIMGAAVGAHHAEALARYIVLYARIPKFEFVKRIAELKGERVPISAEG